MQCLKLLLMDLEIEYVSELKYRITILVTNTIF